MSLLTASHNNLLLCSGIVFYALIENDGVFELAGGVGTVSKYAVHSNRMPKNQIPTYFQFICSFILGGPDHNRSFIMMARHLLRYLFVEFSCPVEIELISRFS